MVRHENKMLYSKETDGRFHIILKGSVQLSTFKDPSGTTIRCLARKPMESILCHRAKHAYFGELHLMNRMQHRGKRWTSKKKGGWWWEREGRESTSADLARPRQQADPFDRAGEGQFSNSRSMYSGHSNPSVPIDIESEICQKL